jgi:lipid A 3-O-deacylase
VRLFEVGLKNFIFIFLVGASCGSVLGQENPRKSSYSREISMDVDNDIFFFIDYYYTAGQDINYRRLVNPRHALYKRFHGKSDSAKVIVSYSAGFKIFTPQNLDSTDTKAMDRPYAGYIYTKFGITNFPKPSVSNRYEVETGIVGRNSRMGQLQRWVHNGLDFVVPAGWNSQIRNETVVNLYYTRYKQIELARRFDVVSQSAAQAGTGGNKLSQDFTFRALRFNSINNSSFNQSRLSWNEPDSPAHKEFFFFFGAGVQYVITDIFIQGSIFKSRKSVFTVPIQHAIIRETFGMMFSSKSVTWNITIFHLSKDVKDGIDHIYASLGMAVRF